MKQLIVLLIITNAFILTIRADSRLQKADSLFFLSDYKNAAVIYSLSIDDSSGSIEWNRYGYSLYKTGNPDKAIQMYKKALSFNPVNPIKQSIYARLSRVYASRNDKENLFSNLNNAYQAGYFNYNDLDTVNEYEHYRADTTFSSMRKKMYDKAWPCMNDPKARRFDFWVGEWSAYQTGTNFLAGNSVIQIASGGCMILENWTSVNAPYSGKSMNFIDPVTNKWEQLWVGSDGSGENVFTDGEYKDGAMRFQYDQKDAAGNKSKGRFTFFNQGPDKVRQLQESTSDDGKSWSTVYDFTYIRKK